MGMRSYFLQADQHVVLRTNYFMGHLTYFTWWHSQQPGWMDRLPITDFGKKFLNDMKLYGYLTKPQTHDWMLIYLSMVFLEDKPARIYFNLDDEALFYFEFLPKAGGIRVGFHQMHFSTVSVDEKAMDEIRQTAAEMRHVWEEFDDIVEDLVAKRKLKEYLTRDLNGLSWEVSEMISEH